VANRARRNPLSRIRLVYRRSSTLVKCVVLAALVLCTLALLTLRHAILDTEHRLEDAREKAAALERENARLEQSIAELGTVQSVTDLAGKLLGLVDPDTVIFLPEEQTGGNN
jgi:cell division protein FtsL